MSTPNETKPEFGEPWTRISECGIPHVLNRHEQYLFDGVSVDTMERIVQCVNFCAGISNEMLEEGIGVTTTEMLAELLKRGSQLAAKDAEIADLRRHFINALHDRCENAYVEVSYLDAALQALSEFAPDHPLIKKGDAPTFGVWQRQCAEIERLKKERDEARMESFNRPAVFDNQDAQISTLHARVTRLSAYTVHSAHCALLRTLSVECTCGLSALTKGEM